MAIKNPTAVKGGEEIIIDESIEKEDEETGRRTIEVNEKEFTVVRLDPHGLWEIRSKNGPVPKSLKNQKFTSPIEAETEITKYTAKLKG